MKEFELILFDDAQASKWQPFTLTRPAGELLLGAFTARARAERIFGATCIGHIAPKLDGFDEDGAAPVISLGEASTDKPRLFLSSRVLLDWSERERTEPFTTGPLRVNGDFAGFFAGAGEEVQESDLSPAAAGVPSRADMAQSQ